MSHLVQCRRMLDIFCEALGSALVDSVAEVLARELASADRIWAAFVDFAVVSVATRRDVVARRGDFLPEAAGALLRAHLRDAPAEGAPRRRGRAPRARAAYSPPHSDPITIDLSALDRARGNMQQLHTWRTRRSLCRMRRWGDLVDGTGVHADMGVGEGGRWVWMRT